MFDIEGNVGPHSTIIRIPAVYIDLIHLLMVNMPANTSLAVPRTASEVPQTYPPRLHTRNLKDYMINKRLDV